MKSRKFQTAWAEWSSATDLLECVLRQVCDLSDERDKRLKVERLLELQTIQLQLQQETAAALIQTSYPVSQQQRQQQHFPLEGYSSTENQYVRHNRVPEINYQLHHKKHSVLN
eukprot:5991382-Amphidinium_carterae.1